MNIMCILMNLTTIYVVKLVILIYNKKKNSLKIRKLKWNKWVSRSKLYINGIVIIYEINNYQMECEKNILNRMFSFVFIIAVGNSAIIQQIFDLD